MSSLAMAAASGGRQGNNNNNNNRRRRRPQSTTTSSSSSSSKAPCIYYNRGYCSRGSSCRFAHTSSSFSSFDDEGEGENNEGNPSLSSSPIEYSNTSTIRIAPSPPSSGNNQICSFYKRGYCSRGSSCHFLHTSSSSLPPERPKEKEKEEAPKQDRSLAAIRARVSKCKAAVEEAEQSLRRSSSLIREEEEEDLYRVNSTREEEEMIYKSAGTKEEEAVVRQQSNNNHKRENWKKERSSSSLQKAVQYGRFVVEDVQHDKQGMVVSTNHDRQRVVSPLPIPPLPPPSQTHAKEETKLPAPKTPPPPKKNQSSLQAALSNAQKYSTPPTEIRIQPQPQSSSQTTQNNGGGSSTHSRSSSLLLWKEDSISLLSSPPSPIVGDGTGGAAKKIFGDGSFSSKVQQQHNSSRRDDSSVLVDKELEEVEENIKDTLALFSSSSSPPPPLKFREDEDDNVKEGEKMKEGVTGDAMNHVDSSSPAEKNMEERVEKTIDDALALPSAADKIEKKEAEEKESIENDVIVVKQEDSSSNGEQQQLDEVEKTIGTTLALLSEPALLVASRTVKEEEKSAAEEKQEKIMESAERGATEHADLKEEKKDEKPAPEAVETLSSLATATDSSKMEKEAIIQPTKIVAATDDDEFSNDKEKVVESQKSPEPLAEEVKGKVLSALASVEGTDIIDGDDDAQVASEPLIVASAATMEKRSGNDVSTKQTGTSVEMESKEDHLSKEIQNNMGDNIAISNTRIDDVEKKVPPALSTEPVKEKEEGAAEKEELAAAVSLPPSNLSSFRSSAASATNNKEEEEEGRFPSFLVEPLSPSSAPATTMQVGNNNYSTPTRRKKGECFFISSSLDEKNKNGESVISPLKSPCSVPLPSLEKSNEVMQKKEEEAVPSMSLEESVYSTPIRRKTEERFSSFVIESPCSMHEVSNYGKKDSTSPFSTPRSLPLPSLEHSNEKKPRDEERFSSFVPLSSLVMGTSGAKKVSSPRNHKKKSPSKNKQTAVGEKKLIEEKKKTTSSVLSPQSPSSNLEPRTATNPIENEKADGEKEKIIEKKKSPFSASIASPSSLSNAKLGAKQSSPTKQKQKQNEKDDIRRKKEIDKASKPLTSPKTPSNGSSGKVSSLAAAAASGKFQNRARFLDSVPETPPSPPAPSVSRSITRIKPAAKSSATGMSSLAAAASAGRQRHGSNVSNAGKSSSLAAASTAGQQKIHSPSQHSEYTTKPLSPPADQTAMRNNSRMVTPKSALKANNKTQKQPSAGMSSLAAAAAAGRNKPARRQQNDHPRAKQYTSPSPAYSSKNTNRQHTLARKRAPGSGSSPVYSAREATSPDGAVHHHNQHYQHHYHTPQTPHSVSSLSKSTPVWERLYHSKDEMTTTPDTTTGRFLSPSASTMRRSSDEHQRRHNYRDHHHHLHHDDSHSKDIDECTFEPDIHKSQRTVPGLKSDHHFHSQAPQHHHTDVHHSKDVEECTFEPNIKKSQRTVPGTNEKAKKYPVYERLHGSYAFVMDDIELPDENDLDRGNGVDHQRQEHQYQDAASVEGRGQEKGDASVVSDVSNNTEGRKHATIIEYCEPDSITTAIKRRNRFNSLREDWMKRTQSLKTLEKDADQLSETSSINSYQSYSSRHSTSSKKRIGRQYGSVASRGGRGGRGGNRVGGRYGDRVDDRSGDRGGGGGRGRSRTTRGENIDNRGKMGNSKKNDNRNLSHNRQLNSISPTIEKSRAKNNLGLRQAKVRPNATRAPLGRREPASSGEGLQHRGGRGFQKRNSPTPSQGSRGKFEKSAQEGQQRRDSERSSLSTASRPQRRRWGDYSDSDD